MKLKFLGTGTSQGVPVIGCTCKVCLSHDSKDLRSRSSVLITTDLEKKILIDCGPDFRQQMLINNENHIDALLLTHEHNDHIIGLDDLRPLIFRSGKDIDIYCQDRVGQEIKSRFSYAFGDNKYPGAPSFQLHEIIDQFSLFDVTISPIEILHYTLPILGFKIKNLCYITDASEIPEKQKESLKNLDFLILNCIRKEQPHPAHFILEDIFRLDKELKPKHIFLTHISHHFGLHKEEEKLLPKHIRIAYDGQEFLF